MKKLRMIVIVMGITVTVKAQQLSTSGQSNLKFYNKAIERVQKMTPGSMGYDEAILDAERKLASIKKTDPGYDVSSMEEEIKKYKQSSKEMQSENSQEVGRMGGLNKELDQFLTWSIKEYKKSKTQEEYDLLDKRVNEQISQLSEFCKNKLAKSPKNYLKKIEDYWETYGPDETQLTSSKNYYAKSEEGNVYGYYETKWLYNKWKLFAEIYPESESVSTAVKKATEVMKMIGSAEDAKKHGEAAKANRIADTKMEPAAVSDPQLESQIKTAILKSKYGAGKTVIKVNIHSSSWSIQKNSVTGAILSRTKGFSAGLKTSDGKCYLLHYVDYKQDYAGGNYGQGYLNLGEVVEILCENVK